MVFLVKRQPGIPADVELVDGAGAFAGDEEADDLRNLLRLDQFGRIDAHCSRCPIFTDTGVKNPGKTFPVPRI